MAISHLTITSSARSTDSQHQHLQARTILNTLLPTLRPGINTQISTNERTSKAGDRVRITTGHCRTIEDRNRIVREQQKTE